MTQTTEEASICHQTGISGNCGPSCEAYGSSDDCYPIYEGHHDHLCLCGREHIINTDLCPVCDKEKL